VCVHVTVRFFVRVIPGMLSKMGSEASIWDYGKDLPTPRPRSVSQTRSSQGSIHSSYAEVSDHSLRAIKEHIHHSAMGFIGAKRSSTAPKTKLFKIAEGIYAEVSVVRSEAALLEQALKSDVFFGLHKLPEPPKFKGSSNFRQVRKIGLPIFGVSQPTLEGVEIIVDHLLDSKDISRVTWINLREEPVVYIDGNSYSPREKETLNINLEYLFGIAPQNLEDFEERLKADVLHKAEADNSFIEFYRQGESMENVVERVNVSHDNVRCLRSIYRDLFESGKEVHYHVNGFNWFFADQ